MKTITFYSYKGGVGRSMALANVAWRLAEKGKRVGIMDLDLEAPGLSLMKDFLPEEREGKVGGLSGFLNRSAQAAAESREKAAKSARVALAGVAFTKLREFGRDLGIGPFCRWVVDDGFKYPGEIAFLPVGETPLNLLDYFGEDHDPTLITAVKQAFDELRCEYLLIDSRTGLTATSSIASIFYPDQVVMVLGLNSQNIKGTEDALRAYKDKAGDIFYLLPSLIPYGEEERKERAFESIRQMLSGFQMDKERLLVTLGLPYHPQLAVEDRPMLIKSTSNFLSERYEQLTNWVIAQNEQDPITCIAKAKRLLSEDEPKKALPILGSVFRLAPFRDDTDVLRAYAEACTKAGFTVESAGILDHLLTLEADADKAAGGKGVPTIKSVLLYYERDKKVGERRHRTLPRLLRMKADHRPDESSDELNRLYAAICEAYMAEPSDIPGYLRFNQEVAQTKPDFAPAAAAMVARIHAVHGQRDAAYQTFQSAYDALVQARSHGIAKARDLAMLLHQWSKTAVAFRDFDLADRKLIEAADLFEGEEKVNNYLNRAEILSKASDEPRKAEIKYLEQVLSAEPYEAIVRVIKRLADLYETEERLEDALEMRRKLLRLEPWDRRDGIVRIDELEVRMGWQLDKGDVEEAQGWLNQNPEDFFTIVTVAELSFLRGDTDGAIRLVTNGAQRDQLRRGQYAALLSSWAQRRWRDAELVKRFLNSLQASPFGDDPDTCGAQVKLHIILGDWENALAVAAKATAAAPDDLRSQFLRSEIALLERLGRSQEVLSLIDREFEFHRYDVNWPIEAAEAYERAGACQSDARERERLFERALEILSAFEEATGPMQLDKILPKRYHILAERMNREDEARRDFQRVESQTYLQGQAVAVAALPDAERTILVSARKWDEAIDQIHRMARYAHRDENWWKEMLGRKADLQFTVGRYEECLGVLERLGRDVVEENIALQFLRLRSLEALERWEPARPTLARIRDTLKAGQVEDLSLTDLSRTVQCELRQKDDARRSLDRAKDCVRWINIGDVSGWVAHAQAAAALYHLTFGSADEAERLLQRLRQIGYYYNWVAELVHDLKVVSTTHGLTNVNPEAVASRFPLS